MAKSSENQIKMFVFNHKTAKFCKFCKALSEALSLLTFGKCKISVLCGMSRSGVVPRTVYVNNGDLRAALLSQLETLYT